MLLGSILKSVTLLYMDYKNKLFLKEKINIVLKQNTLMTKRKWKILTCKNCCINVTQTSTLVKRRLDHFFSIMKTSTQLIKMYFSVFSYLIIKTNLPTLHEKPYFPSPGISWKAQKDQVNIIFSPTFWLKKRSYFPSSKSSKQELLGNQ